MYNDCYTYLWMFLHREKVPMLARSHADRDYDHILTYSLNIFRGFLLINLTIRRTVRLQYQFYNCGQVMSLKSRHILCFLEIVMID